MRTGKLIKRSLLILLLLVIITVVMIYILAGRVPNTYRPKELSFDERENAATKFSGDFGEVTSNIRYKSCTFELTQEDANRYLASMDEIANLKPDVKPGTIDKLMEKWGLRRPVVSMDADSVTLMVELVEYGKILSIDVAAEIKEEDILISMTAARIGKLPVPVSKVKSMFLEMTGSMGKLKSNNMDDFSVSQIAGNLLLDFLQAINGQSMPRRFVHKGKSIWVDEFSMNEDKIVIKFTPEQ